MAHATGIDPSVDGDDLVLQALSEPPPASLDMLRQHKSDVVELLRRGLRVRYCKWSVADWRAFFDERAAIADFDGGLSRAEAESSTYAHCLAELAEPQSHALSPRDAASAAAVTSPP